MQSLDAVGSEFAGPLALDLADCWHESPAALGQIDDLYATAIPAPWRSEVSQLRPLSCLVG